MDLKPGIDLRNVCKGWTCSSEQNVTHFWFTINPHLSWLNIKFHFHKMFIHYHDLKSEKDSVFKILYW